MAQVGIDTFYCEGIFFVVNIEDVFSRIDNIQITGITVCAVSLGIGSGIHHALDRLRSFISADSMTYDLPWLTAHHRYDIDVLSCFCLRFAFKKPVKFVQFRRAVRLVQSLVLLIVLSGS